MMLATRGAWLACAIVGALPSQQPAAKVPWQKWPVFAFVLAGDADGLRRHLAARPGDRDLQNEFKERPIHVAADLGKADCVAVLLAAGVDAAQPSYNGFTALHLGAYRGHLDVVKVLVRNGAPLEAGSVSGTPLQTAAHAGRRDVVLWLRNAGAHYELPTAALLDDGEWVHKLLAADPALQIDVDTLCQVAARGYTAVLRELLPRQAPEQPSGFGGPLPGLCWYAIHHADTIAMLLEQGEDVRQHFPPRCGAPGDTLLHLAAGSDAAATVELLIDKGLPVDVADDGGRTPLLDAAQLGAAKAVATLLRRGAVAHRDERTVANAIDLAADGIDRGTTEREFAARRRIIELLEADGMPPTLLAAVVFDRSDRVRALAAATPASLAPPGGGDLLGRAVRMQHLDVVRALLDAGVPVDATDAMGRTALHWAAFWDVVAAIDLLHERGAATDPSTISDVTPLHEAARMGMVAAARRLLQLGADRTRRTADGDTPASLAARSDHAGEFEALWKQAR